MDTAGFQKNLISWQGTSYGYHTQSSSPRKRLFRSIGKTERAAAMERSTKYLLNLQNPEQGYWVGEIEANTTLTSEYIFLMHFMGTVDELREKKMVNYLKSTQLPGGGWNIYYEGPADLSTTLEAYCAMKLAGEDPAGSAMAEARGFILEQGGPENSRVFTKIFLALLGVYPWDGCPALPPEIMLLPAWFPLNINEMSSWARSTLVPLLILWHHKPVAACARNGFSLEELTPEKPSSKQLIRQVIESPGWDKTFYLCDLLIKNYEKRAQPGLRKAALRRAEQWIIDRQDPTGEWGGIMPAMMNSLMALKCLGYPLLHPAVRKGMEAVHRFAIEDKKTVRLQSCVSPVWDTANTCLALLESGLAPEYPAIRKATDWLWTKQTRECGDWAEKNPKTPAGGWSFEFENQYYPDTDDTLAVLTVLKQSLTDKTHPLAWHRGLKWLLSMQCKNGGWAAFDIDNDKEIWNRIPFADHKSMLDPPTPDITGRILEFLGGIGFQIDHPPVRRAVDFIESGQNSDGSWPGRWGVNVLYGTWCVLCGLAAIGYDMTSSRIRRAVSMLQACQNDDGGWGESCLSYEARRYEGRGRSTTSQTSWTIMGLVAAGEAGSSAVERGVAFLLKTQNTKGSWDEEEFTGTGFPGFFYLRYHMYRDYFPLMALARYTRAMDGLDGKKPKD